MHNFSKATISVTDALTSVRKGLRSPKKDFLSKNESTFLTLFNTYDTLAGKDCLHTLRPLWSVDTGDDKKTIDNKKDCQNMACNLYASNRPFVNDLWENLTINNGGETLFCPICGLHECEEMDHFLPREEDGFPEYSSHLSNLIPLCHKCNHDKAAKFLNNKGRRIFFNAYFDLLTSRDILVCDIINSPIDGLPQIVIKVNPTLSHKNRPDMYILSSISELGLMERFQIRAKLHFKSELRRLELRAGQDWNQIRSEIVALSLPVPGDPDVVYPAVMKAIAGSGIIKKWFSVL